MGMLKRAMGGPSVAVAAGTLATFAFAFAAPSVGVAAEHQRSVNAHRHGRAHRAVTRLRGPRGFVRVRNAGRGGRAVAHAATATTCSSNPCLQYHGGPVLHSNTAYVIYWQPNPLPSGVSAFPTGYETLIDQYLTNVQTADGVLGNVYSVTTQYTDGSGNVQYGFTSQTSIPDSNPLPTKQCTDTALPLTNPCLTDQQIQTEIDNVITAHPGLPRGAGPIYFLVTPQGVGSCTVANPADPNYACYAQVYCAYHSDMNLGNGETLYANMPYADIPGCQTGASPPDHPNNNAADDLINVLSHEHIETITDPEGSAPGTVGAWYHDQNSPSDPNAGEEIGDVCALDYGVPLNSTGTPYNQSIGSGTYELQTEWSNVDNSCQQLQPPSVALGALPSVYVNHTVNVSASSNQSVTFHWSFGDGSTATGGGTQSHTYTTAGTYTVSVTAVNSTTNGSKTATASQTVLNPRPVASFVAMPAAPATGQTVGFDGSASSDTGGSGITAWSWSFGDGTSASGPTATHAYASPGLLTATLTVTDAAGISSSSSQTINVLPPPSPPPPSPPDPTPVTLQAITISGAKAIQDLLSHGLMVNVRCTGVCQAASRLMLRVPSLKHGRHVRGPRFVDVEIGRASGQAGSDGTLRLRITLTAAGRRRLKGVRHPTVTVLVDATGTQLSKTLHIAG